MHIDPDRLNEKEFLKPKKGFDHFSTISGDYRWFLMNAIWNLFGNILSYIQIATTNIENHTRFLFFSYLLIFYFIIHSILRLDHFIGLWLRFISKYLWIIYFSAFSTCINRNFRNDIFLIYSPKIQKYLGSIDFLRKGIMKSKDLVNFHNVFFSLVKSKPKIRFLRQKTKTWNKTSPLCFCILIS